MQYRNPHQSNFHGFGAQLKRVTEPTQDMPLLVAFTGKICSGKGTACDYVLKRFGGIKVSWADAVKIEVYDALAEKRNKSWTQITGKVDSDIFHPALDAFKSTEIPKLVIPTDEEKIEWINLRKNVLRPLLQWWGTDYRRTQDNQYWIKQGIKKVEQARLDGLHVIVNDDTRFYNEATAIHEIGFDLVRIITGDREQELRAIERDGKFDPECRKHASETDLDTLYHDYTVENNGAVHDFYANIDRVVEEILNHPSRQIS